MNLILIVLALLSLVFFVEVLYPSWDSYSYECLGKTEGLTVGGETVLIKDENTTQINICNYEEFGSDEYVETTKHEFVHYIQFRDNRFYDCDRPLGFIINEAEAYTMQNIPTKLFFKIYK